jgi:hypothetical protein
MTMKTQTCQFVTASEVFEGQNLALEAFINSDPGCTWGDNNRSLVTPDVIIDSLELTDFDEGEEEKQINVVLERLKGLPEGVYVDLEN